VLNRGLRWRDSEWTWGVSVIVSLFPGGSAGGVHGALRVSLVCDGELLRVTLLYWERFHQVRHSGCPVCILIKGEALE
jgi:hypothetical protein